MNLNPMQKAAIAVTASFIVNRLLNIGLHRIGVLPIFPTNKELT